MSDLEHVRLCVYDRTKLPKSQPEWDEMVNGFATQPRKIQILMCDGEVVVADTVPEATQHNGVRLSVEVTLPSRIADRFAAGELPVDLQLITPVGDLL